KQIDTISTIDLGQQVSIYLWGTTKMAPPLLYLADPVARGGKRVLPIILQRLTASGDPTEKERLLYLLSWMKCFHYDVARDREVVAVVRGEASSTSYGSLEPLVRESLSIIAGTRSCSEHPDRIRARGGVR